MDEIEVLDLEETKEPEKKVENKNSKTGIIILIGIIIIIAIIGFIVTNKNGSDKTLENKMKKASNEYFEKYMSTNDSMSTYVVTLNMLRNANSQGENYDLSGLEKCKAQTTLSRITINYNNGKPKKTEVELNC